MAPALRHTLASGYHLVITFGENSKARSGHGAEALLDLDSQVLGSVFS
jgi:hypothetical protein